MRAIAGLVLVLAMPLFAVPAAHGQLSAGGAKSAITPELEGNKVDLAGFGHNRVATAVHDPLYVRCVALQTRGRLVVLCAADLIGLFYADVEQIREYFRAQARSDAPV